MSERGLRHLALRSRDLAATERFYVDLLGLEIAFPHKGMLFLQTPGGGDILNFIGTEKRFNPRTGGFDHFGIRVAASDWRQLLVRLKRAGVPIHGRRGPAAIYIEDPNGYTVELYKH
jgi:catechol 2,3-dioxygenase-like lactoylglutathione lyase family enzyme